MHRPGKRCGCRPSTSSRAAGAGNAAGNPNHRAGRAGACWFGPCSKGQPIRAFFTQRGIEAEFVSKVGPAGDVIAKLVNAGSVDLLVMGSHGHGSVAKVVMGSVATKVLASSKVPVLLVR